MDVDVHLIRYYFHTHPNSDDIKNSIGDNGFFQNDVIINFIDPSGKDVSTDFCIEKNDLLVNIAIAKKNYKIRGKTKEEILSIIPQKQHILIAFDVYKSPSELFLESEVFTYHMSGILIYEITIKVYPF